MTRLRQRRYYDRCVCVSRPNERMLLSSADLLSRTRTPVFLKRRSLFSFLFFCTFQLYDNSSPTLEVSKRCGGAAAPACVRIKIDERDSHVAREIVKMLTRRRTYPS